MSYLYRGYNSEDPNHKHEQHFDNESDARDFANQNLSTYNRFEVIDTENENVGYANEISEEEYEATDGALFPDEAF